MKNLTTIILLALLIPFSKLGLACSMYKVSKNGTTIVGNNEDFTSPNSQFWFEAGTKSTFGVMYMGLLNNFAQGAINQSGLMFDGFWEPYLEVKNTDGKLIVPIADAVRDIMQTMTNVEDVRLYLQTINLNSMADGQLVFVDKSGTYLIVEGDEMYVGDESEKSFSNFYYSQIESLNDVELEYFQKGQDFINTTEEKSTLGYCSQAMQNFAQSRLAPTQYSTIYDLEKMTIRVYLFHDFSEFVELDLETELERGNHRTMIADLFSKESIGYSHYKKYNDVENPTLFLKEYLGDAEITEQEFLDYGFENIINSLGYEWLDDMKKPKGAIKVFQYGVILMPNSADLYDSLGEAYFINEEWDNAIMNYTNSLALNPENKNATAMISKINKLKEKQAN
ncbi:MAG: hypothetical protein ACI9RU_001532 [Litorivivens sp.]|jgi:hypothetical protein